MRSTIKSKRSATAKPKAVRELSHADKVAIAQQELLSANDELKAASDAFTLIAQRFLKAKDMQLKALQNFKQATLVFFNNSQEYTSPVIEFNQEIRNYLNKLSLAETHAAQGNLQE
jgi:hypothetical protein